MSITKEEFNKRLANNEITFEQFEAVINLSTEISKAVNVTHKRNQKLLEISQYILDERMKVSNELQNIDMFTEFEKYKAKQIECTTLDKIYTKVISLVYSAIEEISKDTKEDEEFRLILESKLFESK